MTLQRLSVFFCFFLSASYKRGQPKPASVGFHPASPQRLARQQPGDDVRLTVDGRCCRGRQQDYSRNWLCLFLINSYQQLMALRRRLSSFSSSLDPRGKLQPHQMTAIKLKKKKKKSASLQLGLQVCRSFSGRLGLDSFQTVTVMFFYACVCGSVIEPLAC